MVLGVILFIMRRGLTMLVAFILVQRTLMTVTVPVMPAASKESMPGESNGGQNGDNELEHATPHEKA